MIKINLGGDGDSITTIELSGTKDNQEAFLAEINQAYGQFMHRQDLSKYKNQLIQKPCNGCGGGESGF